MNKIKRYDAYLTFLKLSGEMQEAIRQVLNEQGIDIDLYEDALEFTFEG